MTYWGLASLSQGERERPQQEDMNKTKQMQPQDNTMSSESVSRDAISWVNFSWSSESVTRERHQKRYQLSQLQLMSSSLQPNDERREGRLYHLGPVIHAITARAPFGPSPLEMSPITVLSEPKTSLLLPALQLQPSPASYNHWLAFDFLFLWVSSHAGFWHSCFSQHFLYVFGSTSVNCLSLILKSYMLT